MFYISLRDIDEKIIEKLQDNLKSIRDILIRGYKQKVGTVKIILPSELFGTTLPVNLLANKYCPTNRDIWLEKVKEKESEKTWPRHKGNIIHKLYFDLFDKAKGYIIKNNIIEKINLQKKLEESGSSFIKGIKENLDSNVRQLTDLPSQAEKQNFINLLGKIVKFESKIAGCLIDYLIATSPDINLGSEFDKLFPFLREKIIRAPLLGFSERGVKPDFIYKESIIGDIKTGKFEEFHKLTAAAYALGYEHHYRQDMNFGVILNVNHLNSRNVPIYEDTKFFVITDEYRKAFLELRNRKFEIIKKRKRPRKPKKEKCNKECPFYKVCWG